MHIGIDLDNTLICYDGLFHREAVARGWIAPSTQTDKSAVRNTLRQSGRESLWTELQGRIYGRRIAEAKPYDGAVDFIRGARQRGVRISIISHKTRIPCAGPTYDLHSACIQWLNAQGIIGTSSSPLKQSDVHLALTREEKLRRILDGGCDTFIDDLPEFLGEEAFPPGVDRILFDPHDQFVGDTRFRRARTWSQIADWVHDMEPVR